MIILRLWTGPVRPLRSKFAKRIEPQKLGFFSALQPSPFSILPSSQLLPLPIRTNFPTPFFLCFSLCITAFLSLIPNLNFDFFYFPLHAPLHLLLSSVRLSFEWDCDLVPLLGVDIF
ncbi:hypothetical protein VNO77_32141 [Canavalia gladiata]|uniref:Uncharacterized protein n=1 Tax=Canavalia gladiata TaxID=3824 RepID=A0AAN9Q834_CANGL